MEEKNRTYHKTYLFLEAGALLLGTAGTLGLGIWRGKAADRLLADCVMTLFGLAVTGFAFRREALGGALDYNNGEHGARFWCCLYIGLALALLCGFLPAGGWPFLPVFVMLSLSGNLGIGILSSCMLLMTALTVSGGAVEVFLLYLVSGAFAAVLFQRLKSDFKIGIPLCLSALCLLVCETAELILTARERPDIGMFILPLVNMIVSSILLLGFLKFFFSTVIYQYREKYLDINDTENPVLAGLKKENRPAYMHSIHTAYFCERIGKKLGLDTDALKAAAYYCGMGESLPGLMEERQFPPLVREILTEYQAQRGKTERKETAVLLCADTVVSSVTFMLEKGGDRQVDSARLVDAVFGKLLEDGSFDNSSITMKELRTMQRIFKEEKLYYDFLR